MSEITERHRDKAESIALHLYDSEDFWGQFNQEFRMEHMAIRKGWWVDLFTTTIAAKLAELEGDPKSSVKVVMSNKYEDVLTKPWPSETIINIMSEIGHIFLEEPAKQRDIVTAANCLIERLKALEGDPPQDKSYCPTCDVDVPPEDEASGGTHRKCGEPLEPDPPQTSGYVRTEDDLKQPLPEGTLTVGSHDNTVPEGLKEAVRGAWESIAGRACLADNYWKELGCEGTQQMVIERIVAAVKLLFNENEDVMWQAINRQAALKKQIEHQRGIHESNLSAFDKINNEAHEKIAALEKQVEELEEEREGAYKHGYEDAGGSR